MRADLRRMSFHPSLSRGAVAPTTVAWSSWLVGGAVLLAVIIVSLRFSEAREFVELVEGTNTPWLVVAVVLQAATYLAQAEIFRVAPHAARIHVPRWWLCQLSLTKLFLDQALPSAGISSTVVVAQALTRRGVPRPIVSAGAILNIVSYHLAYIVALGLALAIVAVRHQANAFIVTVSVSFIVFAVVLITFVLAMSAGHVARARLVRLPVLKDLIRFVLDADARLIRSPRVLGETTAWQVAIVLLDVATMWSLIRSLGAAAGVAPVFASFMISSVFRTMGIVPGGLGTYEATSVITLRMMGLSLPVALSATLIFRGLSFWLPMAPGVWFARRATAATDDAARPDRLDAYWAEDALAIAARLSSGPEGLSQLEAERRLAAAGPRRRPSRTSSRARVVAAQLRNPLLLILIFAAVASAFGGEWTDAAIVTTIVCATVGITYAREYNAQRAIAALQAQIRTRTSVVRDRRVVTLPVEDIVPGDVVLLSAGSLVPGDGVLLEATDCFVSEAVLTGESFPVEKGTASVPATASMRERANCVFLGTNVRSGSARCLIVRTGRETEFGAVAARLRLRRPETDFDRGVRQFGYLLTAAMLTLVLLVFVAHVMRGRPPVETLLFSVALAVGLSPELLPAILSVSLARGAQRMASHGVVVRHLNAIENLGSMDVLCADKTGTLTEGVVKVEGAYDARGVPCGQVLTLAALNAALETGLSNPLDDAILQAERPDLTLLTKRGEIPFDFVRKRLSVVVDDGQSLRLVTKGAVGQVLDVCTRSVDGTELNDATRAQLNAQHEQWTGRGFRVLAVATKLMNPGVQIERNIERELTFVGFLTFLDRPKDDVAATIAQLAKLGVGIKVITGDSRLVAQHVASLVGLRADRVLTGTDLLRLNDEALWRVAEQTEIFAEVDPNQKERIILALKKMGHVVGFLGDGVNDAPAMHAADTSLSVQQAVDVAREAADFVLLEHDLDVIRLGIEEGRKTFANTLKYLLITISANLGNMISMAAASLFLPFLPLLAGQILLNNFLSDVPAIGLADDHVDAELIAQPQRWDVRWIGRFMLKFGLLSSVFDVATFGVLLGVFHALPDLFRTGWFVESLLTELVVVIVLRTRRPFMRSRPGTVLLASTVALIGVTLVIPYLPFVGLLGFVPLPPALLATLCAITVGYVLATELVKRHFFGAPAVVHG